jgi:hypothetical protein
MGEKVYVVNLRLSAIEHPQKWSKMSYMVKEKAM